MFIQGPIRRKVLKEQKKEMFSQSMPFTLASLKNMKHYKYGICNIILPLTYRQDIFLKKKPQPM